MLLPLLRQTYGAGARIGIMTFDARQLSPHHLDVVTPMPVAGTGSDAGAGSDTASKTTESAFPDQFCVLGMEKSQHFYPMIRDDHLTSSADHLRDDVLRVAEGFAEREIQALVLECTNLSPFKADLQQQLNIQVFDIFDILHLLMPTPSPA